VSAETMAGFLERLGHRIVQTPSAYWYDYRRFFLNFPHDRLIDPVADELAALFRRFPIGVRYFAPPLGAGAASYALVCRGRDYDLNRLSANTRSKIRRGLSRGKVERVEARYVRAAGRAVNEDTLRRIHLRDPYPWDAYWEAVERSEGVEVWAAFVDGELAAYLVAILADDSCEIPVARSSAPMLRFYPNNALLFTVVRDMLARPAIDRVFFGVESVEGATGVDEFKLGMGFVKVPICQRVVLHPLLRPVLGNALVAGVIGALARRRPQNELWRKLKGVVALSAATPRVA
jgi:Acetyltransferase (GNAT) domain